MEKIVLVYKNAGKGTTVVQLKKKSLGYIANSDFYTCIDYKGFKFAFIPQSTELERIYSNSRVEIKEELLQECPFGSNLKVRDIVTYTNEFGVEFEGMKIIGFTNEKTSWGGYIYLSKSSYWFPVALESVKLDIIQKENETRF